MKNAKAIGILRRPRPGPIVGGPIVGKVHTEKV